MRKSIKQIFVIFSFSQTPAQGLTAQAGSDTGEDGAGLWLAVGICPHTCPHTCPSSSLHGLQAMTDCVLELKTVHILWSLGGIPEFAIELGRKPRIGLESKGDGKSQGININGG